MPHRSLAGRNRMIDRWPLPDTCFRLRTLFVATGTCAMAFAVMARWPLGPHTYPASSSRSARFSRFARAVRVLDPRQWLAWLVSRSPIRSRRVLVFAVQCKRVPSDAANAKRTCLPGTKVQGRQVARIGPTCPASVGHLGLCLPREAPILRVSAPNASAPSRLCPVSVSGARPARLVNAICPPKADTPSQIFLKFFPV
jgi:hypothetical protein